VSVRVMPAPLAVTETLRSPAVPADFRVNVSVLTPEPGAGSVVGVRLAVTPAGTPEMDKAMGELKPARALVVSRTATLPFFVSTELGAPATKEKPGTLTVRFATCVIPAPFAETATT
jgi:hypothetical protein